RVRNDANSFLRSCEVRPLMRLINRCIPNCGSTSTSKCTWSGRISSAITSARYFEAALYISSKRRLAALAMRTLRRYLGHQTTRYLLLYTTWLLDLYPSITGKGVH